MITALAVLIYTVLAVLTYGIALADFQAVGSDLPGFQREWFRRDCAMAAFIALFSPFGAVVVFFMSGFAKHGIQFTCKEK